MIRDRFSLLDKNYLIGKLLGWKIGYFQFAMRNEPTHKKIRIFPKPYLSKT